MNNHKVAIITGSATEIVGAANAGAGGAGYNVLINYSKSEAEARASDAALSLAGAETRCSAAMSPATTTAGPWWQR